MSGLSIQRFFFTPAVYVGLCVSLTGGIFSAQADPLSSATVTRVENKVSYGQIQGEHSVTRPAEPQDVVKANDFLLSEFKSKAELRYEDGSIVRVGQNTVFSFEPNERALSLTKGIFVFFIPKNKGGGTIKTPSFTAAITGTIGMVGESDIGILEGKVKVANPKGMPVTNTDKIQNDGFSKDPIGALGEKWVEVKQGQALHVNADGSMTVGHFDTSAAWADASLLNFNGDLLAEAGLPPIGEGPAEGVAPGTPPSLPGLVNPRVPGTVVSPPTAPRTNPRTVPTFDPSTTAIPPISPSDPVDPPPSF